MSNGSPHPSLSPHRMRGEGGFSRVRGVPAHDVDRKLLLSTTLSAVFSLFQLPTRHEPTSDQQGDCPCEIRSTGEPWRAKNPPDPDAGAVRVRGRGVGGRAGGILLLSGTECGLWLSGAFRGTLLPGLHWVPRCAGLCGCRGDR